MRHQSNKAINLPSLGVCFGFIHVLMKNFRFKMESVKFKANMLEMACQKGSFLYPYMCARTCFCSGFSWYKKTGVNCLAVMKTKWKSSCQEDDKIRISAEKFRVLEQIRVNWFFFDLKCCLLTVLESTILSAWLYTNKINK